MRLKTQFGFRNLLVERFDLESRYRIKVAPMIIGALGTVDTLLEDLRGIPKLSKGAVEVMRAMQRTVLCSAVRILRKHLSVEGLGPGR